MTAAVNAGPVVRVEMSHYALRYIQRSQLGPFQAWRDGPKHFSIEYHLANGQKMLTEYDDPAKWKAILAGLDREVER